MKLKKLFGKILGAGLCMGMLLGCMPGGALQVKAATEPNYLTFTAEEAGSTLSLSWASASDVQTSTDHGTTWSAYARGTTITLANVGDSVSFKGRGFVANNSANVNHVKMTGKIAASGSVTSLIDENGGDPNVTLPNDCFAHMFQDCQSDTGTGITGNDFIRYMLCLYVSKLYVADTGSEITGNYIGRGLLSQHV